ncbi:MaoC family dehydratase [Bacillus sp. 1P06AnD]|uniref:MaoC family dehydratase n=1 Tax=Bacillus sp. 1P06AnD TaxID=3132208 RepID=UPI0039A33970
MKEIYFMLTSEDIKEYASLSGDHNPIHIDETAARNSGFNGIVAHGLLSMAKLWGILSDEAVPEGISIVRHSLRFISPVHAGEEVSLHISSLGNVYDIEGFVGSRQVLAGTIATGLLE